jgi:hypothetical protein
MNEQTMSATRPIILLANVGNRNVSYELAGQEMALPDLFQREGNRFDFRARTRQLVEDWIDKPLDISSPFSVQIFADHLSTDVAAVHLFVTDQQTADFPEGHTQDTLYAGELCRRVLDEQHSLLTELHHYQGDPTDEDAIYTYLAPTLRELLARYPKAEYNVRFVDAGGTPGMKTVAKSLLRYYRPEVEVVYTPQAGRARKVAHQQHDRYVLLNVAREFIRTYDYASALTVLRQLPATTAAATPLLILLEVANLRTQLNHTEAAKKLKALENYALPTTFADFRERRPVANAVDFPEADFHPQHRFDIAELASLCELYLTLEDHSMVVVMYYRLVEEIGQKFAQRQKFDLNNDTGRQKMAREVGEEVQAKFPHLYRTGETAKYGLPLLVGYLYRNCSDELEPLAAELVQTIERVNGQVNRGLNRLRNQSFMAHKAQSVMAEDLKREDPGFLGEKGRAAHIFQLLGIPTRNVYDQMNDEILALFAQE